MSAADRVDDCELCSEVDLAGTHATSGREFGATNRPFSRLIRRTTIVDIISGLGSIEPGYVLIVPRRHVATLSGLTIEELHEIAELTQRSEIVLREAYEPGGINVGLNLGKPSGGGIQHHLHVHLVPRWVGDANFMTVIGDTRVLPEELGVTARRLKPIFDRLAHA